MGQGPHEGCGANCEYSVWRYTKWLVPVDGIIYRYKDSHAVRRHNPYITPGLHLVVRQQWKKALIAAHHESILAGHSGIESTYSRLRKSYFSIGMLQDMHDLCQILYYMRTSQASQERS